MSNCDFIVRYNSKVSPRNVISRSLNPSGSKADRTDVYTTNSYKQVGYGATIPLQRSRSAAVIAINENKACEKRALCALNDKFATLIERVRYLEALNKKIQMEHDSLKSLEGQKSDGIKRMYENEIKECESLSAQAYKDHNRAEDKCNQTELQADKLNEKLMDSTRTHRENRERMDELSRKLAANEAEICLSKRRLDDLDSEIKSLKSKSSFLVSEIQQYSMELDQVTTSSMRLENEKNGLEEQLYYLHQTHEQELENARNKIFKDVGMDASVFFKSELAKHIAELRDEYEQRNLKQKEVMEQRYWVRVQELQRLPTITNEESLSGLNKSLKTAISDQNRENATMKKWQAETIAKMNDLEVTLIDEIQSGKDKITDKSRELKQLADQFENVRNDCSMLTRMKTSLETEIDKYRRLMEGDGDRRGFQQITESIGVVPKEMTCGQPLVRFEIIEQQAPVNQTRNDSFCSDHEGCSETVVTTYLSGQETGPQPRKSMANLGGDSQPQPRKSMANLGGDAPMPRKSVVH